MADLAESGFVHIAQQPLFEVMGAKLAGVVVAQGALYLRGGQDLADHVEHGVVVQGVADFLQLVQQPLQHMAFHGVRRHEVDDEAVFGLPVAVDAPHALFQAVGVPRDVVVEQDAAALQVDALAGGLGGYKDLGFALAELALGVQAGAGFAGAAGAHAAVYFAGAKAPFRQAGAQVVERVAELGEDEQAAAWGRQKSLALAARF